MADTYFDSDAEEHSANYIADFVRKSLSKVSAVADTVKERIPATVNERYLTKATEAWTRMHSRGVPVALSEVQAKLLSIYHEVVASGREIRQTYVETASETPTVRVRKVSETTVSVSLRGVTALIDFAEQVVNVVLPPTLIALAEQQSTSSAPRAATAAAAGGSAGSLPAAQHSSSSSSSALALVNAEAPHYAADRLEAFVQRTALAPLPLSGLPRRVLVFPLDVTFRVARQVNLRGAELLLFLEQATAARIQAWARTAAEVRSRMHMGVLERVAKAKALGVTIRDRAVGEAELQKIRGGIEALAARLVQLRCELAAALHERLGDVPHHAAATIRAQVEAFRAHAAHLFACAAANFSNLRASLLGMYARLVAEIEQLYSARLLPLRDAAVSQLTARRADLERHKADVLALASSQRDRVVAFASSQRDDALARVQKKRDELVAAASQRGDALFSQAVGGAQKFVAAPTVQRALSHANKLLHETEVGRKATSVAQERLAPVVTDKVLPLFKEWVPAFITSRVASAVNSVTTAAAAAASSGGAATQQ